MKGNLTIKGEGGIDEVVFCILDEQNGSLLFGSNEEEAASGIAYTVENATIMNVRSFQLDLGLEGNIIQITFFSSSYAESSKWARAFIAAKAARIKIAALEAAAAAAPAEEAPAEAPAEEVAETPAEAPAEEAPAPEAEAPAAEGEAPAETPAPVEATETKSPRPSGLKPRISSVRPSGMGASGGSAKDNDVIKYAKIAGGVLLFLMIFNPFGGSSSAAPPYQDPALFGRVPPPPPPPPPQQMSQQHGSGPMFGFFTSFLILAAGCGIIYFGLNKKKEAESMLQESEQKEPEHTPEDFAPTLVEPDIYTVEFKAGPLGFSLINDPSHGVVIGSVAPGGAAFQNGVQAGFKVLSIATTEVEAHHKWEDVVDMIKQNSRPLAVKLMKNPSEVAISKRAVEEYEAAPPPPKEEIDNSKEQGEANAKREQAIQILAVGAGLAGFGFLNIFTGSTFLALLVVGGGAGGAVQTGLLKKI